MERISMRSWEQPGKDERSSWSYSVWEPPGVLLISLQGWHSTQTHSPFVLSLSGEEQVGAGAAGQAVLWAAAEGAEEETPGTPAQRGEEARCCGGETPAEAEGGESK